MRVHCRGLVTLLFLASMSFLGTSAIIPIRAASYLPHSPITIDGNGNFTFANGVTSGTGTRSDPYIIQGWDINASGLPCCYAWGNAGLLVQNTNASFIIRDVYVHSGLPLSLGINLLRVSNSFVENSVASFDYYGIAVSLSTNITIIGNTVFSDNPYGIDVFQSSNSLVSENNVYSNQNAGIYLDSPSNITVSKNSIHDQKLFGIDTYTTDHNTFVANNISNNGEMGLRLLYSNYNLVYHNNFVSNGQSPPPYNQGFQVNDDPPSTHTSYNPPQNTTNRWDDGYPIGGNYYSDGIHQDYCSGPSQNICIFPDGIRDNSEGINSEYVWNNGANWMFYTITQDHYPLNAPYHATTSMPDYSINTPQPTAVSKGSSVSLVIITINSLGNYSDTVTINATSNAQNTTITPSTTSINLQPGSRASIFFELTAGNAALLGTYALSIHASGSGLTHSSTGTFSISPAIQQPPAQPPVQPPPNILTPSATTSPLGIAILVSLIVGLSGAAVALTVMSLTKRRKNPDPQKV